MKEYRNIIEIDRERCNGCGQCVLDCAEGAIAIIDGKATVVSDSYCAVSYTHLTLPTILLV